MKMQQSNNSNSSCSNVFVLSSESSSRSGLKHIKKQGYASFALKVKHLLEVEGDDLNELYRKVQIIVKKYFNDHKIVEFRDMYEHILALKSNSKKMSQIVGVLQKKLLGSAEIKNKTEKDSKKSDRNQDFEETVSTHKDSKSQQNRESVQSNKEQKHDSIKDSVGTVNTSIKYNYIFKPSIAPKLKEERTIQTTNKNEQYSPAKILPNKLNTSFQQYQTRNRNYENKVRQLMKQLQTIKKSIPIGSNKQVENTFINQIQERRDSLKLNLKQNQFKEDGKSQETIIDICNQNNFQNSSQYHQFTLQNKSLENPKIKKMDTIKQKSKQSISSTPQIQSQQSIKSNKVQIITNITNQIKDVEKPISTRNLMECTANISRQIYELQDVVSRLQLDTNPQIKQSNQSEKQRNESITSIISEGKIDKLIRKASQQKSKKPILDQMQNTTSQLQLSDGQLPSFKKITEKPQLELSIHDNIIQKESTSFPKNITQYEVQSQKQLENNNSGHINISYRQQSVPPLNHSHYMQQNQILNTYKPSSSSQFSHRLSTINYMYNPYQPNLQPSTQMLPNRSISVDKNRLGINQPIQKIILNPSIFVSPQGSSANSSTSIMHPHLFTNKSANINSSQLIKKSGINLNHDFANKSQLNRPVNDQSIVHVIPFNSSSNNSSLIQNASSMSESSLKRKGLNIVSPFPKHAI